jgi:aminopeptidase N
MIARADPPSANARKTPRASLVRTSRAAMYRKAITSLILGKFLYAGIYPTLAAVHVFGDPDIIQQMPTRTYHVQNYKLRLRFDQSKGEIFGDELITLNPLRRKFRHFYLDSSELKIEAVTLEAGGGLSAPLQYSVRDPHLWIALNDTYGLGAVLRVRIVYHGFPRTGLFFVNPTADYPNWPREIWSQGEPEFNHYWFPCWDYPNDMSTSETVTTVRDGESVVSNGKLVKVTHTAGYSTYDWVESIPHSSYLTSLAVGPWREIRDHQGRLPVDYYVPQGVSRTTARRSFDLTPNMIAFFSRAFGVTYPYEKYAQVVVQNFFFGGMENVSATTLTATTLHDARAEPDYSSQVLVAHELGQHWFGDLVQGRDWGDIWLNEGFATYLEALYTQYHNGNSAFRFEIMNDQLAAQRQDREDYLRPIVDEHYLYPLQMLDTTTHEKGAAVLDMLRNVLDDSRAASRPASQQELFFRALKIYLTKYRTQAVNTADLITTIQAVTGRNLNWFFHEWLFMAGFPQYLVTARRNAKENIEEITISQTQRPDGGRAVFDMPIQLAFYGPEGESKHVQVHDDRRVQEFDIPLSFDPRWVDFDPNGIIDKTLDFKQPEDALIAKAEQDPAMMSRLSAVQQLGAIKGSGSQAAAAALARVLNQDRFYGVRCYAATSLGDLRTPQARNALLTALRQRDSRVRTAVVQALAVFRREPLVYTALTEILHRDRSYAVEAAAAESLGQSAMPGVLSVLRAKAARTTNVHVMQGIFAGFVATRDPRVVPILVGYARPGIPERLRLEALLALSEVRDFAAQNVRHALIGVVRTALDDPFLLIQQAGEGLVGAYRLREFQKPIQEDAQNAPTAFQRDTARRALEQLESRG